MYISFCLKTGTTSTKGKEDWKKQKHEAMSVNLGYQLSMGLACIIGFCLKTSTTITKGKEDRC